MVGAARWSSGTCWAPAQWTVDRAPAHGITATTTHARYAENVSNSGAASVCHGTSLVGQKVVNLDSVANTWMRAPANRSAHLLRAIQLAHQLHIDRSKFAESTNPPGPTQGRNFQSPPE